MGSRVRRGRRHRVGDCASRPERRVGRQWERHRQPDRPEKRDYRRDRPGHEDLSFNAKDHRDALNAIKVGDKLTASYLEPYVTELSVAKGVTLTRLNRAVKVTQYSPGAGQEEFQALRVFQGVAEVTAVDRKLNLLTFEDTAGTVHSVRVSRPELVKVMQSLARHSHVRIAYESETTVVVTR
jgi:hypothetical protein